MLWWCTTAKHRERRREKKNVRHWCGSNKLTHKSRRWDTEKYIFLIMCGRECVQCFHYYCMDPWRPLVEWWIGYHQGRSSHWLFIDYILDPAETINVLYFTHFFLWPRSVLCITDKVQLEQLFMKKKQKTTAHCKLEMLTFSLLRCHKVKN